MAAIDHVIIPDLEFWKAQVPCQIACPVHTDAGRYVQLIADGRYREGYLTTRSPNPFASVCGRVCAAPCEDQCRRGKIDAPVSIRALKRFVTEKYGVESREPDTQNDLFAGAAEPGNKWPWHLPVQVHTRRNVARKEKVAVIGLRSDRHSRRHAAPRDPGIPTSAHSHRQRD
jgi:hypothetical protein